MLMKVVSVYDSKAEVYARPAFVATENAALRSWVDTVNDSSTPMNKHPDDYTLFVLGEYDDVKGVFLNEKTPKSLGLAREFLRSSN